MRLLKDIKKVLMTGNGEISISTHSMERLDKRGYNKGDVVSALLNGKIIEVQRKLSPNGKLQVFETVYVVEGIDLDNNPIVVCISKKGERVFKVVTVMPPLDSNRFSNCI